MTERGAASVHRAADGLRIGPSSLVWDGRGLTVQFDELTVPLPRRIRGRVRLYPSAVEHRTVALDAAGRHRWRPIAPSARAKIDLQMPDLSWSGAAYLDTNFGDRPLEADFQRWDWCRAAVPGSTFVLYDVVPAASGAADRIRHDSATQGTSLAMRYDARGGVEDFAPPRSIHLPRTRWGVARRVGAEAGNPPALIATLEDTPFYARSIVATHLLGTPVTALHESLSLDRFRSAWVQAMLPFRMPRAFSIGNRG